MRPERTIYRLAKPGGEYNRLYSLMRREIHEVGRLGWPTVVAERDGRVVGFLSTWDRNDAIWAGPLVIEGGKNMLMFIRLIEAYEVLLRAAGVHSYLFTVDKGNHLHVERVKSVGMEPIQETDKALIFQREL